MDYYRNSFLSRAHPYYPSQGPAQYACAPQMVGHLIDSYSGPTHVPSPYHDPRYAATHAVYSRYHSNNAVDMPTHKHLAQTTCGDQQTEPGPPVASGTQLQGAKDICPTRAPRTASNLEKHALAALNCIFPGKLFKKVRPAWLRNPRTGRLCELDFYSDELKLAVEVQGLQHYVYPNSWHKNRAEWEQQIYRDRLKEELCVHAGITLVHVPFTVAANRVEQYIREEMQRVALPGCMFVTWLQAAGTV